MPSMYLSSPFAKRAIRNKVNFEAEYNWFCFFLAGCFTKAEEHSLPYCLLLAWMRIIWLIPFPKVLVLCDMQTASGLEYVDYI